MVQIGRCRPKFGQLWQACAPNRQWASKGILTQHELRHPHLTSEASNEILVQHELWLPNFGSNKAETSDIAQSQSNPGKHQPKSGPIPPKHGPTELAASTHECGAIPAACLCASATRWAPPADNLRGRRCGTAKVKLGARIAGSADKCAAARTTEVRHVLNAISQTKAIQQRSPDGVCTWTYARRSRSSLHRNIHLSSGAHAAPT